MSARLLVCFRKGKGEPFIQFCVPQELPELKIQESKIQVVVLVSYVTHDGFLLTSDLESSTTNDAIAK